MEFKTITMNLVEHLRAQIIVSNLKPGQRLNENELAASFSISRHPLREAFRILESEHLVVSNPRKGVYVSDISIEDLEKLYQAREMTECYAIELLKEENIRSLPEAASALTLASRLTLPRKENTEELLQFIEDDAAFHKKLIEATNNYWVIDFYNSMFFHLARYLCLHLYIIADRKAFTAEHRLILGHIESGYFNEAIELMRTHIRTSFQNLKNELSQERTSEESLRSL